MNLDQKTFRLIESMGTGDVDKDVKFYYRQKEDVIWGTYEGGSIRMGTITGRLREDGMLDFHYQHLNIENVLMTGHCLSRVEVLENAKLRLNEEWAWTNGDLSKGTSIVEEI